MVVGGLFVYMFIRLGINWGEGMGAAMGGGGHHCLLDKGHLFDGGIIWEEFSYLIWGFYLGGYTCKIWGEFYIIFMYNFFISSPNKLCFYIYMVYSMGAMLESLSIISTTSGTWK